MNTYLQYKSSYPKFDVALTTEEEKGIEEYFSVC